MKFSSTPVIIAIALLGAFILQSCGDGNNPYAVNFDPPPAYDTTLAVNDTTYENGLHLYTLAEGSGNFEVVSNDAIAIRYTGRRQSDGKVFTSSYYENSTNTIAQISNLTPGNTSSQSPGSIKGFRLGVLGMKEGEKRTIVVPPSLGTTSYNGLDLNGKTLVFDVELVGIY